MNFIHKFIYSNKNHPILSGISVGLYPIFYYCSKNLKLVNSWEHFWFFFFVFLLIPVIINYTLILIIKLGIFKRVSKYLIPFVNFFIFSFLIKTGINPVFQKKITLVLIIISFALSYFFWKHYKKFMVFKLILAFLSLFTVSKILYINYKNNDIWLHEVDEIEKAKFLTSPNIYFIQPDGYVNFTKLSKPPYNIDNSKFEAFLTNNGFKNYENFRSNYTSTLSSNSSLFNMRHHYYEVNNSLIRNHIVSDNSWLRVLRNNNYTSHYIAESPYLLLNRPELGFTDANFSYSDIPYLSTGLKKKKDIYNDLLNYMDNIGNSPHFFFIEFFEPGHISSREATSKGRLKEKELWIESLYRSNKRLTELVNLIKQNDDKALIVIMADHGGYVGLDFTHQIFEGEIKDESIINSMFSTVFSIHWPDNAKPKKGIRPPKSAVNMLRYIISVLSEDEKYRLNYKKDESFVNIKKGLNQGVFKYIDENGNVTFEKRNE